MRAFITYARPMVEYNSVIWSLSSVRDIETVERVQRRFYRAMHFSANARSWDRMSSVCPSVRL